MATRADRRVHIAGALFRRGNNRPRLGDNLPARGQEGNAAQHDAPFPGVQQIPPVIAGSLSGSQAQDKNTAETLRPTGYHAGSMMRRLSPGKWLPAFVFLLFACTLVARATTPPAPLNV